MANTQVQEIELSIIILNYDTKDYTLKCLKSIEDHRPEFPYEIILVNNGSKRDRAECFEGLYPELRVVDLQKNVGFGEGNNVGMRLARGRYFLLLNSDAFYFDDSLQIAYDYAEANPQIDVFGCSVLNPDHTPQDCTFLASPRSSVLASALNIWNTNVVVRKLGLSNTKIGRGELGGLVGCYVFLKREVFDSTGGFDPDFLIYCEETEWFRNRISKAGFRLGICEQARIVHLVGGSDPSGTRFKQNILSNYLYWYKFGYAAFFINLLGTLVNLTIAALVTPLVGEKERPTHLRLLRTHLEVLPQVFFDLLRYPNGFGSRPSALSIKEYQS